MKTLNLKAKISNKNDLDEIVRIACKATKGAELKILRDKHKMVTKVTTGALFNFCKDLKLKLTFDLTTAKPDVIVQIVVPNDFNPAEEEEKKPTGNKKAPAVSTTEANDDDDDDNPF